MVTFIRSDLEFILQQIIIAEQQAAGADLLTLLPNVEVPYGLRTVDGSLNNLVAGQDQFGVADGTFPRLLDPTFRAAAPVSFDPDGPGGQVVGDPTSYAQTNGVVFDSQPRFISNVIVDQTPNNPAAVAAAAANPDSQIVVSPGLDGIFGTPDDNDVFFILNVSPDVGLAPPFNAWMTFFGQFFDHGLDLVTKGGNGFIFIPLQADDPLIPGADGILGTADDLPANQRFMVETRATMLPGPDGVLGTPDDIHENQNTTTPFVDQNQTYSSHPSHQVFLRAYQLNPAGHPVATGKLIENRDLGADGHFGTPDDHLIGGMATWKVVKAQARDLLGIQLTDPDVGNVPLLATDAYGNFMPGAHGRPQVVMKGADGIAGTADDFLVEGDPTANGGLGISIVDAVRTGHQFLIDINHSANPFDDFGNPLQPDADNVVNAVDAPPAPGFHDNELLDAHYIAGDGRVNENIGLTVHSIFHSEHNRLVDSTKQVILDTHDLTFLSEWLAPGTAPTSFPLTTAEINALQWNGERLFQAARFGTEMQYQHLVFEEFARTVQPHVDEFLAPNGYDTTVDPSIFAEFAHAVFRLGHSMLTETVDRLDPNFVPADIGLIGAFLNPLAFAASGPTPAQAVGALARGLTREVGNEIDEFVTEAVRDNLLGQPLDLAALNIARGCDTGLPSLNEARREFYAMTQDSQLTPYSSWADFAQHLKHEESLVNFIAAYGTPPDIVAAATIDDKRAVAFSIVFGGAGAPADSVDFLHSTGAWANTAGHDGIAGTWDDVTTTGLDNVDLWIGGLAEEIMPFGGMLGSTFNFVFETQLENLQNGDRFYYLSRTAGLHFGVELEQNSFAKLVMANTDVTHLPAEIFTTPTFTLEVDQTHQYNPSVIAGPDGIVGTPDDLPASADPAGGSLLTPLVIRDNPDTPGPDTNFLHYTGQDHVVLGGTANADVIISGDGDDTIYGDGGNDHLSGGFGDDRILGGDGNDVITDLGGNDILDGGAGNDVLVDRNSLDPRGELGNIILGGDGVDFIVASEDISTIFAGTGNDFILGSKPNLPETGNEGDDWIETGTQDGAPGDNMNPFLLDDVPGNDIFVGGGGFDEMIGEGGDDIFVGSDAQDKMDGMSGFDWTTYKNDRFGVTVDMRLPIFAPAHGNPAAGGVVQPVGQSPDSILDRFAEVEGLSGSAFADILRGDDQDATIIATITARGSILTNIALIHGLQEFLGAGVTSFGAGNIILGGDGSDIIEGNGGDDLIDGDRWLNVRISVHANPDGTGPEIASFDSMQPLVPLMLAGKYDPGQLVATREILPGDGGFDTANFRGLRADYTIVVNDNGTPGDFSDDIVTVTDVSAKALDGTDRLTHIERLQFADQSVVLVPGLNQEPSGQLTINDAVSGTPDTTPTVGQLLRASDLLITDGDNVSATNPTGAVTGPISYVWQVETTPGTGVFDDIILKPGRVGIGFPTADGTTFMVTPDLAGLAIRVKGIYADAHGVTEQVFSAATAPVSGIPAAPPAPAFVDHTQVAAGEGIHLIRSDLDFILSSIKIAEAHAAGGDLLSLLPNVRSPLGLRTVDGTLNNLIDFGNVNQTDFGSADTTFPRLTHPVFHAAERPWPSTPTARAGSRSARRPRMLRPAAPSSTRSRASSQT
jgi:Ca2+-binding RTX toxin-like protein